MAPRPQLEGDLKLSLVSCPIALYPATSASERVSFNQINKNTGNRIRYRKVDEETDRDRRSSRYHQGLSSREERLRHARRRGTENSASRKYAHCIEI